MVVLLEAPVRYWKCPSCGCSAQTQRAEVHTEFHNCPAIGGVGLPLVEVHDVDDKPKGRQIIVPSEYGPGNAAVRTERLDGSNDVTVFPPTAVARMET